MGREFKYYIIGLFKRGNALSFGVPSIFGEYK